jgi:hypothetical protein
MTKPTRFVLFVLSAAAFALFPNRLAAQSKASQPEQGVA